MWRAFFLSIGIYACILGGECLVVERVVLNRTEKVASTMPLVPGEARKKEITPPDWAPWSLLSFGVITMIYSFTIPKRIGE